jgi:hypothetical protein
LSDQLPAVRASDAERDHTVELLRRHAGEGRLTHEELAERIDRAYLAGTRADLDALTADLPASRALEPRVRRRPKRFSAVAFGGMERKGRWRVPRRSFVAALFGDANIDLRAAGTDERVVTITTFLLFGNADFFVPGGVDVDLGGFTAFGHRREHGDEADPVPDTPLVRIRVFSLFGTSDVWRVPADATGSYRELIKAVRAASRQRELTSG